MQGYPYSPELKKPFSLGNLDLESRPVVSALPAIAALFSWWVRRYVPPAGVGKRTFTCPSADGYPVPCFLIEPENTDTRLPVLVYFHGGGFIFPLQRMMMRNAAYFAKALGLRVVLPEYRLAPRHPFPAALEDCYATLEYIGSHAKDLRIDPGRVIVYGESAGGCLAAGVTRLVRDRGGQTILAQMLIYPATDDSSSLPSMDEYRDAVWSKTANRHMWNLYLGGYSGALRRYAAPLHAGEFTNLPPAYIEPQEMDTLRDEAVAYAEKLSAAGVPVELEVVPASYHGFDMDHASPLVQRMLARRADFLKRTFDAPVA